MIIKLREYMRKLVGYLIYCLAVPAVQAATENKSTLKESPKSILKIEDFLPERKSWSFGAGVNILNNSNEGSQPGYYINQISPGQYIIDRTNLAYKKETNGLSGYLSGMYGLTSQLSLSATLNGQWVNTKYSTENNTSSNKSEYKFNGIGFGASYQLYRLSDFTVLFGGVNAKDGTVNSYVLGTSLNWIYDPLVLNFSLGYLDGISREKFSNDYTAYTTSGKVIFAVNPEINLSWGFSKDFINANNYYLNKKEWTSTTSVLAGMSVNLMEDLAGNINLKGGVGNNKSSVISLGLSYKL
ncbi:hypothetical protein [Winslowiella iniecta]|nr:hypothetical protein [Winslowiella iniecta]